MPGPTPTGKILVLYGHGAVTSDTFDFKRTSASKINLYSWTRESIPVWDIQIQKAANTALSTGKIEDSYATVNSSRIGGTPFKDYVIGPPAGLALPTVPNGFASLSIPSLSATLHHNADNSRMLLMLDDKAPIKTLSDILYDNYFSAMSMDVLWCACKSDY